MICLACDFRAEPEERIKCVSPFANGLKAILAHMLRPILISSTGVLYYGYQFVMILIPVVVQQASSENDSQ